MGRKGSGSDLLSSLFGLVFTLIKLALIAIFGMVKLALQAFGSKKGRVAKNRPGIPPKPRWEDFRHSGKTYEESHDNFDAARDKWFRKYGALVYGDNWENEDVVEVEIDDDEEDEG